MEAYTFPLLDRFINSNLKDDQLSFAECVNRDVLENITHILKTTYPPGIFTVANADSTGSDYVENSVLNFGIPPFTGSVGSDTRARGFTESIRRALLAGEPRINASTLRVEIKGVEDDDPKILGGEFYFSIHAELSPLKHDNALSIETRVNPFRVPEIVAVGGNTSDTG